MKVVTVHRGARDGYQVARGLHEAGLLEALVTDVYWPADRSWARGVERLAPRNVSSALQRRNAESVPSSNVLPCWISGLSSLAIGKGGMLPFRWKRDSTRWCDRSLGRRAGRLATNRRAALLTYSYYGHSAFSNYKGAYPRILFQLHPHPESVRKILQREISLHPDCASSLEKEWELALPEQEFRLLVEEASMADHWIVASSFTKSTLIEAGIPGGRIDVVPYGIDLQQFSPRNSRVPSRRPLQLLFVGTLGQRKGIKYLIEALSLLPADSVELTVCGRAVDDLELFKKSRVPLRLFPSISQKGLIEAYRSSDVFVFPSLAEGFAQVLLEAMASGLPVIGTTRTAAPDLIRHGQEGYVIEPGDPASLAGHIEKFLRNRGQAGYMGEAARRRAEYFTWERFRQGVAASVTQVLSGARETSACLQS